MADGRKKNGGRRKGAGRKPKAEEQELIERLSPLEDSAHQQLEIAIKSGEKWAIELFFAYRYGKPKQTTDTNITGQLNVTPISFLPGDK